MFKYASAFNQNISNWNTSHVTNMNSMFWGAQAFNQNISNWDTSQVTNMSYMFDGASAFNNKSQSLSEWKEKIEKVTDMRSDPLLLTFC